MGPDENKLIDDFSMLARLPLPDLKWMLYHKLEQLKHDYKDDLQEYRDIVDTEKYPVTLNKGECQRICFELKKTKAGWTVSIPNMDGCDTSSIIPRVLVDRILNKNLQPGLIHMDKMYIAGRLFCVSYEKHSHNYYSGSITEKENESDSRDSKDSHEEMDYVPIVPQALTGEKKVDLKTFLSYLLNHDIYYKHTIKEFTVKWRPFLDNQIIKKAT